VVLSEDYCLPTLPQLRSFALWLPKHVQLVKSVAGNVGLLCGRDKDLTSLGEVLRQALQAAAAAAAAAHLDDTAPQRGPAAVPAAAGVSASSSGVMSANPQQQQQQQQQQQGWRLGSFSCDMPGAAGMLAALPAHSLTHLDLDVRLSGDMMTADGLSAALARLSNLQQLCIQSGAGSRAPASGLQPSIDIPEIPSSYLVTGVGQLTQLTSLILFKDQPDCDGAQHIAQLLVQPLLRLRQLRIGSHPWPKLDLAHLSQLEEVAGFGMWLTPGTVFPPQLKRLGQLSVWMGDVEVLDSVYPLQQLQHLSLCIGNPGIPQPKLVQLALLPALQHLSLHYSWPMCAAETASAWPLLPQLRELTIESGGDYGPLRREAMADLLAGLAGCAALTKLQLQCTAANWIEYEPLYDGADNMYPEDVPTAVCSSVAGLLQLKELEISRVMLVPGDAAALTSLTGLTYLSLYSTRAGVDTAAAGKLASCLKQLRHFDVSCCDFDLGMEFMAAVGQLTQLTQLKLGGNGSLTEQGLMQLTGLTRLQHLQLYQDQVAEETLREFWADVSSAGCCYYASGSVRKPSPA
jgi:hypothetical protein